MSTDQKDLFICHSSVDKDFARTLGADVEAEEWSGRKLSVFLDEWDIGVGENITLKINDALAGARYAAILLSPEMVSSEWCRAEMSTALYRDPSNRTARVIPLRVRDVHLTTGAPIEVPPLLAPLNYLDFRTRQDYARSFARLLATLRGEAPPRGARRVGGATSEPGSRITSALPARVDPDDVPEALLSNLLRVTKVPSGLFVATTKVSTKKALPKGVHFPAHVLREGKVLSFQNPSSKGSPFGRITTGSARRVPLAEWRTVPDKWRWIIELFNETLREYLYPLGIRFSRDHERYFCVPNPDQKARRQSRFVRWGAGTERWVARAPDEGKGGFWVHHAAELRFHDFAGQLYLSIDPTFLFTLDGGELVSGERARSLAMQWTARERNAAVLARVLLWADAIARGRPNAAIATDSGEIAFERLPLTGRAPVSIDEHVGIRALLTFADATIADAAEDAPSTFMDIPAESVDEGDAEQSAEEDDAESA